VLVVINLEVEIKEMLDCFLVDPEVKKVKWMMKMIFTVDIVYQNYIYGDYSYILRNKIKIL